MQIFSTSATPTQYPWYQSANFYAPDPVFVVLFYNTAANIYYPAIYSDGNVQTQVVQEWIYFPNAGNEQHYTNPNSPKQYYGMYDVTETTSTFVFYDRPDGIFNAYFEGNNAEIASMRNEYARQAREYFDTPQSGSGTATVEIDIEGEDLTFESEMLEKTITQFIDDDAEVDMESE